MEILTITDPSHEDMLLEMCSCFGVSEEDILLLLDYDYTADDIEEMLMDLVLISETVDELKEVNEFEDIWEYCV